MPQPFYNKMESGSTTISGERIYQLAKLYKVSIADFFCEGAMLENEYSIFSSDIAVLKERLSHSKLVNEILVERNTELQQKLERRDRKIEALISRTQSANSSSRGTHHGSRSQTSA